MAGVAHDWNVVVLGAWNTAILTPAGIQQRVFNLAPGTPIEVEVAINEALPPRITHDGLTVVVSPSKMVVTPTEATDARLKAAGELASRAVQALNQTPFRAIGINFRYRFDNLPQALLDLSRPPLDDRLVESDRTLSQRMVRRTMKFGEGQLNLEIIENDQAGGITMANFHLQSADADAIQRWATNIDGAAKERTRLLRDTLGLELEGIGQ